MDKKRGVMGLYLMLVCIAVIAHAIYTLTHFHCPIFCPYLFYSLNRKCGINDTGVTNDALVGKGMDFSLNFYTPQSAVCICNLEANKISVHFMWLINHRFKYSRISFAIR